MIAVHSAVGLHATLRAIARGVTVSTPFQEVAVTIAEVPHAPELRTIAVIGSLATRAKLLGTACRRSDLLEHIAGGEPWGALRFRPGFEETGGVITHTPKYEPLDVPDAWQPQYELIAPLYEQGGELVGMLSLDRPRDGRVPPTWVIDILELFTAQAVIAVLNARRHEQDLRTMTALERERAELHAAVAEHNARATNLRSEIRRDRLTGLANRVRLRERLEELLAERIPIAVVFCDLDRFKQINDVHGHAVGDAVLQAIGRRLVHHLPDAQVLARVGGDEFVVVAGAQSAETAELLGRIEQAFSGAPVRIGELSLQVKASLGLVFEPAPSPQAAWKRQAEQLLNRADHEMYTHKRAAAGDELRTDAPSPHHD